MSKLAIKEVPQFKHVLAQTTFADNGGAFPPPLPPFGTTNQGRQHGRSCLDSVHGRGRHRLPPTGPRWLVLGFPATVPQSHSSSEVINNIFK